MEGRNPETAAGMFEKPALKVKEGDMLVYAHSMVTAAFNRMYKKETNMTEAVNDAYGLRCTGTAVSSDEQRVLTIQVQIPKNIEFI